MTMPFGYVSPEQVMKDRADYARKGIARGRSVVVLAYDGGILFVAENLSRALHKISEIYDRIAFAAVGKYNEFENLRMAGVRYADLRGYSYDRQDVTGRGLANVFAQTLGTIFTVESKPYEVEIVVAEVGETADDDQIYRLTYDGSVADEHGFVAMGGSAEAISTALDRALPRRHVARGGAAPRGRAARPRPRPGEQRTLTADQLEVAVLDRARPRRKFRRLTGAALGRALGEPDAEPGAGPERGRGHQPADRPRRRLARAARSGGRRLRRLRGRRPGLSSRQDCSLDPVRSSPPALTVADDRRNRPARRGTRRRTGHFTRRLARRPVARPEHRRSHGGIGARQLSATGRRGGGRGGGSHARWGSACCRRRPRRATPPAPGPSRSAGSRCRCPTRGRCATWPGARAACASTGTPSTWATRAAPPARRTWSVAPRPCT